MQQLFPLHISCSAATQPAILLPHPLNFCLAFTTLCLHPRSLQEICGWALPWLVKNLQREFLLPPDHLLATA